MQRVNRSSRPVELLAFATALTLSGRASDSISGNPAFLVVRYEFTPGFEDPNTLTAGGRGHYWVTDYLKIGVTSSRDEEAGKEKTLHAGDVTLRSRH